MSNGTAHPDEVLAGATTLDGTSLDGITLDETDRVLTPEYVEFNFVLAGLMSRLLAWLIDSVVSIAIATATLIGVNLVGAVAPGFSAALSFVTWFLIHWGYMVLLELVWSGQTLGKRALGLRVISDTGVRVSPLQSLLRNLVRPVDKLPVFYLVGGVAALLGDRQQRLGDLLAGTVVVRDRRLKVPAALEQPGGDVSLLNDADFLSRVGRLSQEEEATFLSAALRREELEWRPGSHSSPPSPAASKTSGFTRPPHLSDEKLVVLVTAALAARNSSRRRKPKVRSTSSR